MQNKEKEINKLWEQALHSKKVLMEKLPPKSYDLTKEECYLEQKSAVPVIRFHAFDSVPYVNAAFSTRFGGVSSGYFSELNLGFGRGDLEENVVTNYRLFCDSIKVDTKELVLSDQVHDTKLHTVRKEDCCTDGIRKKLSGIDGLMTNQSGFCLATSYADCVPLFFADTAKKVIASSHSGWRGTVGKMGQKTVDAMEEQFGSKKEDIIAVIGPSICQSCYEVSEDVIGQFMENYPKEDMDEIAYCSGEKDGKYQLDLWAANFLQLKKAGLLPEHIHVAGICTCCNHKLLFSHRASKGKRGNLNGFISLNEA